NGLAQEDAKKVVKLIKDAGLKVQASINDDLAMVYLAAAVVMVPIAKKLGLGSVLGYLLAGILIGPAVLGFIGNEGQDVLHFAEFGVVIMLFVIGLELEPELLWKLRRSIVGLGGLQVVVTAAIFAAIAMAFGLAWKAALAMGMILSLSSTAIVLQTLNEKGLMKTSAGQSSFSVLLFQDIAVIPMLAIFPLLATYSPEANGAEHHSKTFVDGLSGWLQTLVVLGSVAVIILAGRFVIRPLFRIVAATRLREIFTATALLLVVGIAVLMTQVGLSPALGTFLAGVVLADSEYKHELESDIDPFKGLLLGLFFIAVIVAAEDALDHHTIKMDEYNGVFVVDQNCTINKSATRLDDVPGANVTTTVADDMGGWEQNGKNV
ncbi:transporter, CPA2 family, partial [Ostertagia ostertagi]